jgi:hypothetical protein
LFEKKSFLKNQKHQPNIVEITHLCIMHGVHTSTYIIGKNTISPKTTTTTTQLSKQFHYMRNYLGIMFCVRNKRRRVVVVGCCCCGGVHRDKRQKGVDHRGGGRRN